MVAVAAVGLGLSAGVGEGAAVTAKIGIECRAAAGVASADRTEICAEFARHLAERHPGRTFEIGSGGAPRIDVLITAATPRALGMEVAFVAGNGARTQGKPLRVSFFDRGSSPEMRQRFYSEFLKFNPLPF